MKTHWTNRDYSLTRALRAYLMGMIEFRSAFTLHFESGGLLEAYDGGRDLAHFLTFRRYDESV